MLEGIMDHVKPKTDYTTLLAVTRTENIASKKVLLKCQFHFQKVLQEDEHTTEHFTKNIK
jgi:RimJ/RimL family protein N-acetyltransferase